MSWRDFYTTKGKFRNLSDDELLAILLIASDRAKSSLPAGAPPFELHPAEKALANEYLLVESKLDGFCRSFPENKAAVREAIEKLLDWPCPPV